MKSKPEIVSINDYMRHLLFARQPMVEFKTTDPQRLHRRLYKAAKRRGWGCRFARTENSVIVINPAAQG